MYPQHGKGEKVDYEDGPRPDVQVLDTTKQQPQASGTALVLLIAKVLAITSVIATLYGYGSTIHGASKSPSRCPRVDELEHSAHVWNTIPISWYKHKEIVWKDCYGEKQCARFAVPLDYLNESEDGPWATIALIRVPAKVSRESPAYRGPILFNPGGPGGSGVVLVLRIGEELQQVVGGEFDVVGFDPRGVGFTTPKLSIFENSAEGMTWLLRESTAPLWNSSSDAIARIYARSTVLNNLIRDRAEEVAGYVSTASVARDMLEITRAHGRDKLQYWGYSYGSILGATYAAMFPNNVERLIIDGVMDTRNYYSTLWSKNLVDTEKGLGMFFEQCADAGPELCGLYEPTSQKVEARYNALIETLKRRPLAVLTNGVDSTAQDYGVIDYSAVKSTIFLFLYNPYAGIPGHPSAASRLSFLLNEVEKGNGLPLWNALKFGLPHFECKCGPDDPLAALPSPATSLTILCGDGEIVDDTIEELEDHQLGMNSTFADLWPLHARCSNWRIRPKYRFTGPYGGNTSFPLLIIGNTADPVTPLASAHSVARDFKNSSVVLTQNSAGHCSLTTLSICMAKAVRDYFQDGELPKPGTVCEIEGKMFTDGTSPLLDSLTEEERDLMDGWGKLSAAFSASDYGLAKGYLRHNMY